jgi:hypothetical protein
MRAQSLVKLLSNAKGLTQKQPLKTRDLLLVVMPVARGNRVNPWGESQRKETEPGTEPGSGLRFLRYSTPVFFGDFLSHIASFYILLQLHSSGVNSPTES